MILFVVLEIPKPSIISHLIDQPVAQVDRPFESMIEYQSVIVLLVDCLEKIPITTNDSIHR